jgi:hypothetical protein
MYRIRSPGASPLNHHTYPKCALIPAKGPLVRPLTIFGLVVMLRIVQERNCYHAQLRLGPSRFPADQTSVRLIRGIVGLY